EMDQSVTRTRVQGRSVPVDMAASVYDQVQRAAGIEVRLGLLGGVELVGCGYGLNGRVAAQGLVPLDMDREVLTVFRVVGRQAEIPFDRLPGVAGGDGRRLRGRLRRNGPQVQIGRDPGNPA